MVRCRLITFAPGKHAEHYDNNSLLSGYCAPHEWTAAPGIDYAGCVVIDVRVSGWEQIISGPMVDVLMSPGDQDPLMARGYKIPEWLRRVSIPEYIEIMTRHGGIIGRVTNGRIDFHSDATEK